MCLRQAKAVSFEGHPTIPAYNGVYRHDATHKGWPVLKNASGRYCFRYTRKDKWILTDDKEDFAKGIGNASIVAKQGPLPVGAHTWQCWVDEKWVDSTLTVGLLVRILPSTATSDPSSFASASSKLCSEM